MRFSAKYSVLLAMLLALATSLGGSVARADVPTSGDFAPSVWTDKTDYAPGEHVVLSGSHWQPGEVVQLSVNDDAGSTWNHGIDVTADSVGNITDQFDLPNWFVAVYTVRATGASGATYTYTFTDSNVKFSVAPGPSTTATVKYTTYTSSDCSTGAGSTNTVTGTSAGTTVGGVSSTESVKLEAASTSDQGGAFKNWTGGIATTTNATVCIPGPSGTLSVVANYDAAPTNAAPAVAATDASVTVDEGTAAANSGTWSDANAGDTVTLSASVGTVTKSGTNASGTWSWSYTPADGPLSQTVTITADDGNGGVTTATFGLTADNVAPTATLSAPDVEEGESISVSLSSPQDVAADLPGLQYAFDCGSGYGAFGASNSTSCPTSADGTRTVKAKVRDKDSGETEYTRVVTISNAAPVAGTVAITPTSSTAPTTNSTLTATPSGFSDPGGDALSYHYTWKNGSTVVGTDSDTLDLSQTGNGDKGDTITVSVTASDGSASSDAATDNVTVKNTAPTAGTVAITPSSSTAPTTDSTLTATRTGFSDDDGDTLTYHYTWKNGATVVGTDSDTLDLSQTGNGDKGDTITVSVTAFDGSASSGAATDNVTVKNAAPTANAGGGTDGYSGQEGAAVQLDGSSADADGDTRTYDWSYTGPATCSFDDHTLADPTITCADNGSFTVSLTVTDSDGASSAAATAPLAVDNVAPTATWNRPSSDVDEGDSFTLSLTDPQDVAADLPGLDYRFDCGAGYSSYSSTHSKTCSTSDNGTLHVAAQVRDKDGDVTTYTDDVTVQNVAPTITSFTGTNSLTGALVFAPSTFTTTFTDPGTADSWYASFSYSDGLTDRAPSTGSGFTSGDTVTHRFATPGCNQTATAVVTDDDGGSDTKTATVNVGTGSFLAPLSDQPVTDKLKNGQVLPVKVRIADCNGAPVMNLSPAIKLVKGDLTSIADDTGQALSISSASSADTGTTMRAADGYYIYNLRVSVPASDVGQDFTIIIYPYGSATSGATLRHVIRATK